MTAAAESAGALRDAIGLARVFDRVEDPRQFARACGDVADMLAPMSVAERDDLLVMTANLAAIAVKTLAANTGLGVDGVWRILLATVDIAAQEDTR